MAKYLFRGSYTASGAAALLAEGGSPRRASVEKLAKSLGGSIESMYFAFGGHDAYVIAELPDHSAAVAFSLAAGAGGGVQVETVVLLTAAELDAASKRKMDYRPPVQ
jgi:uncharacterized protein with GYD domain